MKNLYIPSIAGNHYHFKSDHQNSSQISAVPAALLEVSLEKNPVQSEQQHYPTHTRTGKFLPSR